MRNLLVQFALWVLRRCDALPASYALAYARALPFIPVAKVAVAKWQPTARSGMSKRHQAYAELMKEFPLAEHRDLSMAIEIAVGDKE